MECGAKQRATPLFWASASVGFPEKRRRHFVLPPHSIGAAKAENFRLSGFSRRSQFGRCGGDGLVIEAGVFKVS